MKKLSLLVLILCMIPFICSAWILKDEFNTNRTAGNVDGTSAEPIGGTRTVVDTYASTELITNGGFETAGGGGADVFGTWTETAGDGAIADETTIVKADSHAAKLTSGATSNTLVYQAITTIGSKEYTLTFWSQDDGTNKGRYYIYDVTNSKYLQTDGTWAVGSNIFTATGGATYAIGA